jgi:hypothetical protein
MRGLAMVLSLVLVPIASAIGCPDPVLIRVAPVHIDAQCEYGNGAIAAEGDAVFGAWMKSRTGGFGAPTTTGSMSGGRMTASGHLVDATQQLLNQVPARPSVATNGTTWMLAWTRYGATYVQPEGWSTPRQITAPDSTGDARVVWNGRDFIVIAKEGAAVFALRLDANGAVVARNEIARDTSVGDAVRSGDGGTLVVTPQETILLDGIAVVSRHTLIDIPSDAIMDVARNGNSFLVAWHADSVGAWQLDANGERVGRVTLAQSAVSLPRHIAVAVDGGDYVVLWTDYPLVRGVRVRDLTVRATLEPVEALVLDATSTSGGMLALLSRGCGVVETARLEGNALVSIEVVSREVTNQVPLALDTTPRGNAVVWSEAVPTEKASRVYASHVTGNDVSAPALLSTPGALVFDAKLEWPTVVWAEYPHDTLPGTVRAARLGDDGKVLWNIEIASATFFVGIAVSGNDIYTAERSPDLSFADVYRTQISNEGSIVSRTLLRAHFDPLALQAAPGVLAWFEAVPGSVSLLAREDDGEQHVLPVPFSFALHDTVTSATPMVLWSEREEAPRVHAWFPQSGADVLVDSQAFGLGFAVAEPGANGTFDVAVARWPLNTNTLIDVVNVSASGTITPRQEVCFPWFHPSQIALRNGLVDAVTTSDMHQVVVVRQRPSRRRSLH